MSARTVAEKLQVKPGESVRVRPAGHAERLFPLPEGAHLTEEAPDIAFEFITGREEFVRLLPQLERTGGPRITWVCYPKGNRADVNRDSLWALAKENGWTMTGNISVDGTWSALRMKPLG